MIADSCLNKPPKSHNHLPTDRNLKASIKQSVQHAGQTPKAKSQVLCRSRRADLRVQAPGLPALPRARKARGGGVHGVSLALRGVVRVPSPSGLEVEGFIH